ncbi:MAG: hypothetical protein K6E95_08515 [Lachnospiraceae bacterium]|nr:hypothetical protein [Lachnospiraceae bacterium]
MNDNLHNLFLSNIKLLAYVDRAICCFRMSMYDRALEMISLTGEGISGICDAVIGDRDYFSDFTAESVEDILSKLLEAKKAGDYTLLADLYEMQLVPFICSVQELIINREDLLVFNEESYKKNIKTMRAKLDVSMLRYDSDLFAPDEQSSEAFATHEDGRERFRVNRNALLEEPMLPEQLLEQGYTVEFTSSGLMTLKAPLSFDSFGGRAQKKSVPQGKKASGKNAGSIYLHTNMRVVSEGFLLAGAWMDKDVQDYSVLGLGLGYHVNELANMAPSSRIMVFESDMNIIKLYCAFTDVGLLDNPNVFIVYDPDMKLLEKRITEPKKAGKICVHYPSFRRTPHNRKLSELVPWSSLVEKC